MIIVHLIGGLGNQMFQYALGRSLAYKNNTELKLDVIDLNKKVKQGTQRHYALNVFKIQENFVDEKEVKELKGGRDGIFFGVMQKIGFFKKNNYIIEPKFSFNPEVLKVGKNAYLQGYWQSEKYFKDIRDVICQEFTLKDEYSIEDNEIVKEIKNYNTVSLHIRRGDYIADAKINKFHGCCSLGYYNRAVEYIAKKVKNPVFYIFSDDIEWVKENLKINFPTKYVSDGILKDYEELILMSYCKHNIIANSSFSWWGAWLNDNPEKIVITPNQWFADKSIDTSDVIPENWKRL